MSACPRCGEEATGKFCANCGSALKGAECPDCNGALTPGAQFCHHCGAALKGAAPAAVPSRVPWVVTGVALVAVIALVLFQASRSATDAGPADTGQGRPMGGAASGGGMPSAADIAAMSPQEQADRLFNRVMMYASQGQTDSAAIFAPMALQAFDMLAPLDVHQRFDVGLVTMVSGQLGRAKAEADTILRKNPKDLLGLTLAMRVAEASKNSASVGDYAKRLIAAEPGERKLPREEYQFHSSDIDAALKDARARKP